MRSLIVLHLYADFLQIPALRRLSTATISVLHSSILVETDGILSLGAPTALPLARHCGCTGHRPSRHPSPPFDFAIRDIVDAHNLSLVRKRLASQGASAAGCDEAKWTELFKKMERGAAVAPCWTPDFPFHPMGCDFNGAWGRAPLRMVDVTSRPASQRMTETPARIRRRSIRAVSRHISEWNATLT
jgi:hypothetical protein